MTDQTSTPSSRWKEAGEEDVHGKTYDCERAQLCMGDKTDDEMAYDVYIHGNATLTTAQLMAGEPMALAYLTGARDRIRWLSRSLEKALAALTKMTEDRNERLKNNLNLRLRNDLFEERLKLATDLLNDIHGSDPSRDLDNRVDAFTQLPDITAKTE